MRQRLDKAVTERGLASSRERAQILISGGLVTVDGQVVTRASQPVDADSAVVVTGEALPYVSRGGVKMEAALRRFRLNVRDALCLDVGASTGGFTDCLLQRGARKVIAVDVGHGQMAPALAADPRVELREGINARYLSPEQFAEQFDLAAIDVSFISVTLVLPAVVPLVRPGGYIVVLIKPEFERGPHAVGPRGVVRSADERQRAVNRVRACATKQLNLELHGVMQSPITGGSGNREFMACFRVPDATRTASGHGTRSIHSG